MSTTFSDWQDQRKRSLEADRARRRRIAKSQRRAANSKPAPPDPAEPYLRTCRVRLKLRTAAELDSEDAGEVLAGARVRVLDRRVLACGNERALVARADDRAGSSVLPTLPVGWVTAADNAGCSTLLELTRTHAASPDVRNWLDGRASDERGAEEAWAGHLSAAQFRVLRMRQTDEAHTGSLTECFNPGTYCCAACGKALYQSSHKFESACGWPSFSVSVDGALTRHEGRSVEITCSACGGHVGHVYRSPFHPGPKHERHCANSTSLRFVAERELGPRPSCAAEAADPGVDACAAREELLCA